MTRDSSSAPIEPEDAASRPVGDVEGLPNPAGKSPVIGKGPGSDTDVPAPPGQSDRVLLAGPNSRVQEFVMLARAMRDFLRGIRVLHFVGPCVTVFGSPERSAVASAAWASP
jgi:hypothetical protein